MAAVTAAITSSISISSWTSASRRIRVTAGRIAPMTQAPLNVGLIGLGTLGAPVAERMLPWRPQLYRRGRGPPGLLKVLVGGLDKPRPVAVPTALVTPTPAPVLHDPAV